MKKKEPARKAFLSLLLEEQALLIKQHSPDLGMLDQLVEKDIWICWTLEKLFEMPGRLPMGFKGGTSLSKAYGTIDRFSEDVDITLDYKGFGESLPEAATRNQIDKLNKRLKDFVLKHTRDTVKPYFEKLLWELSTQEKNKVAIDETGEEVRIFYPSVFGKNDDSYLRQYVLLEFGGRNIIEPNEEKKILPYLSSTLSEYEFPEPTVTVLAFMRTFWEKITLAHVECHRDNLRSDASRLSRHWYDIYKMSLTLAEDELVRSLELLADVVRHKKIFFHSSYANYDACLKGKLRIVPDQKASKILAKDFNNMVAAGMFYIDPPSFQDVLEELRNLEQKINELVLAQ